jgi:hypothetical protein
MCDAVGIACAHNETEFLCWLLERFGYNPHYVFLTYLG